MIKPYSERTHFATLTVNLEEDERDLIKTVATRNNMSISDYVKVALNNYYGMNLEIKHSKRGHGHATIITPAEANEVQKDMDELRRGLMYE